jgi:Rrf2 family nitric oxide-sensitive transcriptional repressor
MRLNKVTTHSIRLLVACARCGEPLLKVADLSEILGLTKQNAFKIVHLLSRAGFVKATRGPHGGVALARPAKDIRVGDVVRAMEALSHGAGIKGAHGDAGQGALFDEAFEAFIRVLNRSTIADMMKGEPVRDRTHQGLDAPRPPQPEPRRARRRPSGKGHPQIRD